LPWSFETFTPIPVYIWEYESFHYHHTALPFSPSNSSFLCILATSDLMFFSLWACILSTSFSLQHIECKNFVSLFFKLGHEKWEHFIILKRYFGAFMSFSWKSSSPSAQYVWTQTGFWEIFLHIYLCSHTISLWRPWISVKYRRKCWCAEFLQFSGGRFAWWFFFWSWTSILNCLRIDLMLVCQFNRVERISDDMESATKNL
jgi:hypothetical protein